MRDTGLIIILLISAVYSKPHNLTDEPSCGYDSCHAVDHDKINVHLIPHSHDDVGWLSTVHEYYYHDVQYIISSVIKSLLKNCDRRFIQVETAYFYMWWNEQKDSMKSDVRKLINEGRLEIVNGAWSMNDEAAVHYQSTIDQYTLGLRFIEDNLGKCARPRVGWQIDPFGHSREQASLLTQFGMDGIFFARIDYRDKQKRKEEKTMDMLWTGSSNLGSDSTIFASVLADHYNSPPNFCFDMVCKDPPIVTYKQSSKYNWENRTNEFVNFIRDQIEYFPTKNILVTLGGDFTWKAAYNSYINVDRLIEGFKTFNPKIDDMEINVIYSTPSCYTKAVHDYVEAKGLKLSIKTDDFFPIADGGRKVWAGYFSSRPTSKRLERIANNLLQISKQITTFGRKPYGTNKLLSQAMGVMQHHDAITGTEKSNVEKDYHKSLVIGMEVAISDISSSFSDILRLKNDLNLKSCLLSNVSICTESDKDEFTILIYNPLARVTSHYIQIPVNDGTWRITGPSGEDVENQLTEPISNFNYIAGKKVLGKVLFFRAENLPALGYKVYNFKKVNSKCQATRQNVINVDHLGFPDRYVNFNPDTGLLQSITLNEIILQVSQKMMYYVSSDSGAYIFRPDVNKRDAIEFGPVENSALVSEGNIVREIKQVWKDWATQIIRVYKDEDFIEFDWLVGPINVTDKKGKEIITRYTTELNTDGVFYTDSNGREMIYRKKNYRPTYKYTGEEPQAGNYYPINTKILIKDGNQEFAVLPDRSEGGTSLSSGEIELMLSRALMYDDDKGVGENLNELEYQKPLVARGSHFVTLGLSSVGNGGRTMAAVERDIAQRKLLQPWVFYTSKDVPVKEQSFLNINLPDNIHLLTLENWNETSNRVLIRFEHILEKNEDPNLSKQVTIDVSDLFKTIRIISMKEYFLAANTPLEESTRLKWSQIRESEDELSPLSMKNRLSREENDLIVTLAPMQIRTFVAIIEQMFELE